jgi:low affinity Fe/Cu permease
MNIFFTKFTDWFSEVMGTWPVFFFFVVLMLAWIGLGPVLSYSDSWQLYANTPTTWIELFLGLAVLGSANRIEKRNYQLHLQMEKLIAQIETLVEQEKVELDEIKTATVV